MAEDKDDWIVIDIPDSMCAGPPQRIYCLEGSGDWRAYVLEVNVPEDDMDEPGAQEIHGRCRWCVNFKGKEVASGQLRTAGSAKMTAVMILNVLISGPEPEAIGDANGPHGDVGSGH